MTNHRRWHDLPEYKKYQQTYKKQVSQRFCGENNPTWKGDKAGLIAIHQWVRRRKPQPSLCEKCNLNKPYDLANISQQYKRDINDFEWLCRKCHMTDDNRIINFNKKRHIKKGGKNCTCNVL